MSAAHYDFLYSKNKQYFGDHPENLLRDYFKMCDKNDRVLDIGIGQGRNSRFLLHQGYSVDGIDISSVAIENLNKLKKAEDLNLNLFNMSFEDFKCPPKVYSAVMVFGLFQVLSEEQSYNLAQLIRKWLKKNGVVFVSGFTTNEMAFRPQDESWEKVSENHYHDGNGNFRTFMDIEEAMSKFKRFKPIYQWEGYGERHTHGTEQIEQHHMYEFIIQKQ